MIEEQKMEYGLDDPSSPIEPVEEASPQVQADFDGDFYAQEVEGSDEIYNSDFVYDRYFRNESQRSESVFQRLYNDSEQQRKRKEYMQVQNIQEIDRRRRTVSGHRQAR